MLEAYPVNILMFMYNDQNQARECSNCNDKGNLHDAPEQGISDKVSKLIPYKTTAAKPQKKARNGI